MLQESQSQSSSEPEPQRSLSLSSESGRAAQQVQELGPQVHPPPAVHAGFEQAGLAARLAAGEVADAFAVAVAVASVAFGVAQAHSGASR